MVDLVEVNDKGMSKLTQFEHGIGSINKTHLLKHGLNEKEIDNYEVEGITFLNLLDLYPGFSEIDYLQFDTEWLDFEILKMIDFKKLHINFIKYQKENLSKEDLIISEQLLKDNGFEFYGNEYDNYCFKNGLTFCLNIPGK
jgi:hypothetical protein